MAHVGYVRVSTVDQNTVRQLVDVTLDKVFEDKCSGKDVKRPQLAACLDYLREGDTLHVHSIDRLARNLGDLQRMVGELNSRGVVVSFHQERLEFTGDDSPMQHLMLHLMGAFAQFERALLKERQREGIAIAKAEGRHLGRAPALSEQQQEEIRARVAKGEEKKALAAEFGVSRQTVYRVLAG